MRHEHDGEVLLGGRIWAVDRMGLPGPEIELLVAHHGETLGFFILSPTLGSRCRCKPRVLAVALPTRPAQHCAPGLRSA